MKRFDKYQGLGFGIIMIVFLIIQSLWTVESYNLIMVLKAVTSAIIAGAVAGFLYGLLVYRIKNSKYFQKNRE